MHRYLTAVDNRDGPYLNSNLAPIFDGDASLRGMHNSLYIASIIPKRKFLAGKRLKTLMNFH